MEEEVEVFYNAEKMETVVENKVTGQRKVLSDTTRMTVDPLTRPLSTYPNTSSTYPSTFSYPASGAASTTTYEQLKQYEKDRERVEVDRLKGQVRKLEERIKLMEETFAKTVQELVEAMSDK